MGYKRKVKGNYGRALVKVTVKIKPKGKKTITVKGGMALPNPTDEQLAKLKENAIRQGFKVIEG